MTKAFLIFALSCLLLSSLFTLGICLWTAWLFYHEGLVGMSICMCVIAAMFVAYQSWVVLKNESAMLVELKSLFRK